MSWSCRTGLVAEDCISDHYLPPLKGWPEPAGARAPCPVCHTHRGISVQIRNKRVTWNQHCKKCDRPDVGQAISSLVPCEARRARKSAPDADELIWLALSSLPPTALRLGLLEMAGMSTTAALDKLGVARQNRYRVVSALRQNRRS